MRKHRPTLAGLMLAFLMGAMAVPAWADRDRDDRRPDYQRPPAAQPNWNHDQRRPDMGPRQLDSRYYHNRYYPPRGTYYDHIPRDHLVVPYRDTRYYFHGGVWYRPDGLRFVVVAPPVGLTLSLLPPYYTTVWIGGAPYYYADGVYYTWRPSERVYEVVEPPKDSQVVALPPEPEQLFIYPKQGQSEQQQANDRYDCHRWAVDQTDFDPTEPGGGVPQDQAAGKRTDYQGATKACLEARGYSVR